MTKPKIQIEQDRWVERSWQFGLPVGLFPQVLERVRGTPARASELVSGVSEAALTMRLGKAWSAQEHLGHLDDLHQLDETRLGEFIAGVGVLTPADMGNVKTETAEHNQASIRVILERFRRHRQAFVQKLEALPPETLRARATHKRLGQTLSLVDWLYFIAEHDDHHLAKARAALSQNIEGNTKY